MYEKDKKRRQKIADNNKKLSVDDAAIIAEQNQTEYEKNKAMARKAHIQFPTPRTTDRSERSRSVHSSRLHRNRIRAGAIGRGHPANIGTKNLEESMNDLNIEKTEKKKSMQMTKNERNEMDEMAKGIGLDCDKKIDRPQTSAMDRYKKGEY